MADAYMESLEKRVAQLEAELLRLAKCSGEPNIEIKSRLRKFKRTVILGAVLLCGTAVAGTVAGFISVSPGANVNLQQYSTYDSSSTITPTALDSLATWMRDDSSEANSTTNGTTELLSLIADGTKPHANSFQWPLYVELRGTTNSGAGRLNSQSAGSYVRSIVESTGSPWTVGYHSELAHGMLGWLAGPSNEVATNGTSILFNGEMRSFSAGGETIGVNLQCVYTDSTSKPCDNGINIQTGAASTPWENGIHFDGAGSYTNGNIGINFDRSVYNMGVDLANNSLRMNAGQKVVLEGTGQIYITYNQTSSKVEIWKMGKLAASF